MWGGVIFSIIMLFASLLVSTGYIDVSDYVDYDKYRVISISFSLFFLAVTILGVALMMWVPNRVRLLLSTVRICQIMTIFSFCGPIAILGFDKIYFNSVLIGELAVEKTGASSLVGLLISLVFLNKFQKRYDIIYKEDYLP